MYARLDQIRGPEDAAADLMELWGAAESAMRAMLGGSTLGGQSLVRELRQRGMLNLEQANALASFWDAKARADDVGYKPTLTDVGFARAGYNELARAINEAPAAPTASGSFAPPGSVAATAPGVGAGVAAGAAAGAATAPGAGFARGTTAGAPPVQPVPPAPAAGVRPVRRGTRSPALLIALAVLVLVVIAAAAYFMRGSSSYDREMASAIDLMQTGRNEGARAAFSTITREYPDKGRPHVFLSRLARMDGDVNTARQELVTAIRLEPGDELALREMGVFLIAQGDYDLARNFLVRAVKANGADSAAQGYLGCALYKANRIEEAQRFLSRAGTGSWSSCTATPPAATGVPATTP